MNWLVRSPGHQITGLFSKDELISKIQAGEFSANYEICPANGYWIYLHETKELESQLGITLPTHILPQTASTPEEAKGDITEDFPEEPSRTMQIKPAPLAPRLAQVVPPPAPTENNPNVLVKLLLILIGVLGIYFVLNK